MHKNTKPNPFGPKTTGSKWADDRIGRSLNRTEEQVIDTAVRVLAKLEQGNYAPKLVWERVACDNVLSVFGASERGTKL